MKTIKSILIATLFSSSVVFGQAIEDALRLSQTETGGTARYMSMGGAFSALGADFSSLSTNPAGIAAYRSSEFTFTPTLYQNNTESNYLGSYGSDSKSNFNLNNIGYVGTTQTGSKSGIISFSFGLGYNRLKNFNRNYYAQNTDLDRSLTDDFAGNFTELYDENPNVNYEDLDAWPEPKFWDGVMAWDSYLINFNAATNSYLSLLANDQDIVETTNQRNFISEKGKIDEYLLSFGMNVNNNLLLGATVGIQDMYFKKTSTTYENFAGGGEFTYNNNLNLKAYGINLKLGAIYLPTDNIRLGFALHTPTFINLDEDYSSEIIDVQGLNDNYDSYSPLGAYSYDLQTPFKYIFGGAVILNKRAIISVDYELADYSSMQFSQDGKTFDFIDVNQNIDQYLDLTHTIRTGVEFRVTPEFSLRGGYSQIGAAYANDYDLYSISGIADASSKSILLETRPQEIINYSFGFGYRDTDFFIDAAFVHSVQDVDYLMFISPEDYITPAPYVADITSKTNKFMVTVGLKF